MKSNENPICSECGQISKSKKYDSYGEVKLRNCPNCGAISKYENGEGVSNVKSILMMMIILIMGKII